MSLCACLIIVILVFVFASKLTRPIFIVDPNGVVNSEIGKSLDEYLGEVLPNSR